MYIKIMQCTNKDGNWYKDLLGKEFEVYKNDEFHKAYVIDNVDGSGNVMGCVFYEDCKIIDEISEENKFICPKKKTQIEVLQDTIDKLLVSIL